MFLAVDIGNTYIKFGVFNGPELIKKLSIPTVRDITAEALARLVTPKIDEKLDSSMVSSVVPELNDAMFGMLRAEFDVEPLLVRNDMDFGMKINYQPLEDAGSDRLVNTFCAVEKYGTPCIVCSFGTALTIDAVDRSRTLVGGLIAPGMKTLAAALRLTTSRLPEVTIEKPDSVIQNSTVGSIRSGIVYGYFGLVEDLLKHVRTELGESAKVIATGGFAPMIAENTSQIDIIDDSLMLDGLRRLLLRNASV